MTRATAPLLAIAVAVAAVLALAGCGSDSDGEGSGGEGVGVEQMLDRVPSEAYLIRAMDLATAKQQLGIAADLDPERYREYTYSGTPEERFNAAVVPSVLDYFVGTPSPFAKAIDHGKVRAAVSATMIPGGQLVILNTRQPLDEIERGLERAGLTPSGEHGFVRKKDKTYGPTAAALGDGLVVLAESLEIANGVLRKTAPDPRLKPARRLLAATRGDLRIVHMYPNASLNPEYACLRGMAGGQLFGSGKGDEDLAVLLDGEPRASEVTLGRGSQQRDILTQPYRVTDVARSGQTLSLKVRIVSGGLHSSAATIAEGVVRPHLVYRCPGAAAARKRREIAARQSEFPPPPGPDRSGSRLETRVSGYIAAGSTAPNPVRVRCPVQTLPKGTPTLDCTGTRPHKGRTYHYTMTVAFQPNGGIKYVEIESKDDKTETIVTNDKDDKPKKPQDDGT